MSKYTFIQEDEQFGKRTFEFRATSLEQMLDQYKDFLLAAGFVFDPAVETVAIVPFDEAPHCDVVIDWSDH